LTGLLLALAAVPVSAATYFIDAHADPPRPMYQDNSPTNNRVIIWVRVRDDKGAPAPDMTPVRFSTSLGAITPLIYTRNGEATTELENTQGPGRARVDIQVEGNGITSLYVEYLGPNGMPVKTTAPPRLIYHLKARQVYYSTDKIMFDLRDGAEFTSGNLRVQASSLQFDVKSQTITAQFGVTVTKGKQSFTAVRARLELQQNAGDAEVTEPETAIKAVDLSKGAVLQDAKTSLIPCTPLDPQPTRTWILCTEATVFPNDQQIQFTRPKFYLNGVDLPILWMPYHVVQYNESTTDTFINAQVTLTSDPGVNIDFPIYYAANASHIGSLHIRSMTKNSSPTGVAGMQYGIEEEYRLNGDRGNGALYLDDLTRPTRSLSWDQTTNFGATRMTTSLTYDRYSATDAYTTRTNFAVSRALGQVVTSLTANWSKYKDQQTYDSMLNFSTPMLKLGHKGYGLNFSPFVGWQSQTGSTAVQTNGFTEGMNSSLGFPTISFLGGTVQPNVSDGIAHRADESIVNNFDAGVHYQRHLFGGFMGAIGYSYNQQQIFHSTVTQQKPTQGLDLNITGIGKYWNTYGYATYSLNDQSIYSAVNFTYYLPWDFSRKKERRIFFQYGARASITSADTGSASTIEHIFTLGRPIGTYTLMLHYSPTGNTGISGIGLFTNKKWALELARSGW